MAFLWVEWRISRALKDAGSVEQPLDHPCFSPEAREGVWALLALNRHLERLVARDAPQDVLAVAALRRQLVHYQ